MSFNDNNEVANRGKTFEGFVQFEDPGAGTDTLRLKERQQMAITYRFLRETHFDDAGVKTIDWAGYDHQFQLTIKLTADMFDTIDTPTLTTSISYWIDQNMPPNNNPIQIVFIATATTDASSNRFIRQKFTLIPHTFGPITWNRNSGTNEITISGEIIAIEFIKRTATAPVS